MVAESDMNKTLYVLGYLLIGGITVGLFKRYIYDNIWVGGLLIGIVNVYGVHLYNKKFNKKLIKS